eukprot:5136801-Amphidinium_carterae.2
MTNQSKHGQRINMQVKHTPPVTSLRTSGIHPIIVSTKRAHSARLDIIASPTCTPGSGSTLTLIGA